MNSNTSKNKEAITENEKLLLPHASGWSRTVSRTKWKFFKNNFEEWKQPVFKRDIPLIALSTDNYCW